MEVVTEPLFRDDAYLPSCEAVVRHVTEAGGVVLDRTVFYASGGGQPGDIGRIEFADGTMAAVANTVYGDDRAGIVHLLAEEAARPAPGDRVIAHLDWEQRYKHMRMHTALHLLTAVLAYPVTGGQIGAEQGRLDFDIPEGALDKDEITEALNRLIEGDHAVTTEWITDAELEANPGLVKTMSVKPPMGSGRVRLVRIGDDVDLQPCGGTHVLKTGEIGTVVVSKIEKKGKLNRRVRLQWAENTAL
ncbi:misacylated tRNA(Ala) deacylase [Amorphus suaedae]